MFVFLHMVKLGPEKLTQWKEEILNKQEGFVINTPYIF